MLNPIASLADAIARFVRSENEMAFSVAYCAENVKGWPDKVSETDKATMQFHLASESWETTKDSAPKFWRKGDQYLPATGECPSGWEEYQPNFLDLYTTTAGSRGKAAWLQMDKNEPGRKKAVQEPFNTWKNTHVSQRWTRLTGAAVAKLQKLVEPTEKKEKKSARVTSSVTDIITNACEDGIKKNKKTHEFSDQAALEKVIHEFQVKLRGLRPIAEVKAKTKTKKK